ncbi:MAG: B12-binding domain-containing radical SAM protein, partial [Lachnospiraceae bacterium]
IARRYYEIPKEERNGKCQITISTSFFVPKPFTPFQWVPMYTSQEYISKAHVVSLEVREQLNQKSMKYNWHEADVTVLEGVFARGDRRTGKVIAKAYQLGCLYDAWSDYFHNDLWLQAFEQTGVDINFYTTRQREMDEILPWDFIDIGVTKEFLKQEWTQAVQETVTPNCRMSCSGCGAGQYKGGVCIESKN